MKTKILLLGRKDIKHEKFGGSEVVLHEYMKGLVNKGYDVTQISTNSKNNPQEEIIDGIKIIRKFTIHYIYFVFWVYYLAKLRGKYDLIIDHAGGIPMLSPWYEYKTPIIFFTHHVGNKERSEYFKQRIGMGWIGNIFRRIYNNIVLKTYKYKPTITVSESSANELLKLGFNNIYILPNTTNVKISPLCIKPKENIITILGRVIPNKRLDHAIRLIGELRKKGYKYKLNIIGNTQDKIEYEKLLKLIKEEELSELVTWHGMVSEDIRNQLLIDSKYLLITSIKEGFGIVVLEANALGIPAIGYNISGVREAISNNKNGLLVEDGDIVGIANVIINIDDKKYEELVKSTNIYISNCPKRSDNVNEMEKIIINNIKIK